MTMSSELSLAQKGWLRCSDSSAQVAAQRWVVRIAGEGIVGI